MGGERTDVAAHGRTRFGKCVGQLSKLPQHLAQMEVHLRLRWIGACGSAKAQHRIDRTLLGLMRAAAREPLRVLRRHGLSFARRALRTGIGAMSRNTRPSGVPAMRWAMRHVRRGGTGSGTGRCSNEGGCVAGTVLV